MKATLEFNLPEEEVDYKKAVNGPALYRSLVEIREHLRSKLKYFDLSDEVKNELEMVLELIPLLLWEMEG